MPSPHFPCPNRSAALHTSRAKGAANDIGHQHARFAKTVGRRDPSVAPRCLDQESRLCRGSSTLTVLISHRALSPMRSHRATGRQATPIFSPVPGRSTPIFGAMIAVLSARAGRLGRMPICATRSGECRTNTQPIRLSQPDGPVVRLLTAANCVDGSGGAHSLSLIGVANRDTSLSSGYARNDGPSDRSSGAARPAPASASRPGRR